MVIYRAVITLLDASMTIIVSPISLVVKMTIGLRYACTPDHITTLE